MEKSGGQMDSLGVHSARMVPGGMRFHAFDHSFPPRSG